MATIASRKSVLAIVPETTEGTPVAPSAATQYTALQAAFSIDPALETVQSEESFDSLGAAKPIVIGEKPTVTFPHYLRASGVEGQAPDYNDVLKAFYGSETVNSTQRTTSGVSSTTVLNVQAGTGADFVRGTGMLIKDGTNGYRVRVSHERSTDAITLSFALPTAPATGVSLGKCVSYKPADTGHQTLAFWHYMGNGGGIQMVSGVRCTSFTFDATARQLLNATFEGEGIGWYQNPIEITSSTRYIDFTDDDGTFAAAVPVRWYKNPKELATAIQTALNTANAGETHTCTYSNTTGKFTITSTGAVLSLLWNTGANAANTIATKIGFSAAANSTGALTYTSANAQTLTSPYTPTLDSSDPLVGKNHEVMIGDQADYTCFEASSVQWNGELTRTPNENLCAETGVADSQITERSGTVQITALLKQYDVEFASRFQLGTETRFQYSFGPKVGGNWVPGYVGYKYLPECTVTKFKISEDNGLFTLEMELSTYVKTAGVGEMYCGFL